MKTQEVEAEQIRKQSMLYEICPHCEGEGDELNIQEATRPVRYDPTSKASWTRSPCSIRCTANRGLAGPKWSNESCQPKPFLKPSKCRKRNLSSSRKTTGATSHGRNGSSNDLRCGHKVRVLMSQVYNYQTLTVFNVNEFEKNHPNTENQASI